LKGRGFSRAARHLVKGTGFSPYVKRCKNPGFSPRWNFDFSSSLCFRLCTCFEGKHQRCF
jgi:hypothetical protein